MTKRLAKDGRIYLTPMERDAAGVAPGDVIQINVRLIKKGVMTA